jgi:hypothetical protein
LRGNPLSASKMQENHLLEPENAFLGQNTEYFDFQAAFPTFKNEKNTFRG